jgi:eukaryotic translation initiation factor 2C
MLTKLGVQVTFVLSVKRHHLRFLPANQREGEGRNGNIPAGTVVDTGVTDPRGKPE